MMSEKHSVGRKRVQWDVAREFYIKGDYSGSGMPIDVTMQEIADKFSVSVTAVWKRAKKYGWEEARRNYRQQIFDEEREYEEKIRIELRKAGLPQYSEFLSQMGRLCYLIVGKYLKLLTDEKAPKLYFSDVLLASDKLEKILMFLEGRQKLADTSVDFTFRELILELANVVDDRTR